MNKMNQVILEGNVVRTPLFKETPHGTKVCTMPIAVDRLYKDRNGNRVKEVGFYDIEAWGEHFTAAIAKHGLKGRGVRVIGRIKQNRWKTTDGRSMSKTFVVAEHVDFRPVFGHTYPASESGGTYTASSDADAEALQAEIDNLTQAADGIRAEYTSPPAHDADECVF